MNITFPGLPSQRLVESAQEAYYITHYRHVKNYLVDMGIMTVSDSDTTIENDEHNNNFIVDIDGKQVMFDYSDHDNIVNMDHLDKSIKYFKVHTTSISHPRCIPFPPMSFPNWSIYNILKDVVSYNPKGEIFYKCNSYGNAVERRGIVMEMLKNYDGVYVNFDIVTQVEYFLSMMNCRINVIVPGARKDILDRTHMQSFALGIPVISPFVTTLLPFGQQFEPNIDYIECKPDFSDVIDLIERYKDDKEYLDFISKNCKTKFQYTCTPERVREWILQHSSV